MSRDFVYVKKALKKKNRRGKFSEDILKTINHFNPQAFIAQKIADEVVFRQFQVEGVEFL